MTLVDRETAAEVVDVGLWTLGVVQSAALVWWQYTEGGVEAAAVMLGVLTLSGVLLGVLGRSAVADIDAAVEAYRDGQQQRGGGS